MKQQGMSRRGLFRAGAGAGLVGAAGLGAAGGFASAVQAAMGKGPDEVSVMADGSYATIPLKKDVITMAAVQSRVRAVQMSSWRQGKKENLAHMLDLIDAASGWTGPRDLLFFHEFPITGYDNVWNREDILKFAIEVPGEETEAIGKKAKELGTYIVFGSYARDKDWPNHVLSLTTIVGPDGTVVDKHWKARNIKGVLPVELFTSTIYDCFDEYVEKYGLDNVIPVTRTDIGNICTSSVQREPELFRAFALKGCEIMLRTASGGFTPEDIQITSEYNNIYTVVCNNAVSPNNPNFIEDTGSGGSAIYGPNGDMIAKANSEHETIVGARVPIADFRKRHKIPLVHWELYKDVWAKYVPRYPTGIFSEYQPTDVRDSARYVATKDRWAKRG